MYALCVVKTSWFLSSTSFMSSSCSPVTLPLKCSISGNSGLSISIFSYGVLSGKFKQLKNPSSVSDLCDFATFTKNEERIMSIITVGGHEVLRNLSEPSDQTLMQIDVYADYLRTISPETPSTALRALLTRSGGKSIRIDSRYTEAYGPHEVMLNIDGINIYSKTMITREEHPTGQIYVDREELKVRSIGQC